MHMCVAPIPCSFGKAKATLGAAAAPEAKSCAKGAPSKSLSLFSGPFAEPFFFTACAMHSAPGPTSKHSRKNRLLAMSLTPELKAKTGVNCEGGLKLLL